jgi:hypothetical protein
MNAKLLLVGVAGLIAFGLPCGANGQDEVYASPYALASWGCYYPGTYSLELVPYFTLHPPVYYSYRVARTYGYSPFPYPPGVLTPGSEPSRPAIVRNVYVDESAEAPTSGRGPQPLRIDNPFVDQPGGPGVAKGGKPAGRQPQVVYPTAMAQRAH